MTGRLALVALTTGAAWTAIQAAARTVATPAPVFACSLGKKSVSVRASGGDLLYSFGAPGRPEISITGSAARGNVRMYASSHTQLRFVNGRYSYVIYSLPANPLGDARAVSGLVVLEGTKKIADMACTRFASFKGDYPLGNLPEDSETYSAMSVE